MAKAKVLTISGPLEAKHVGGINVLGGTQVSSVDSYFDKSALQPDTLPSHTFVASGRTEVPRRSDTITNTIRRPSVSLRRNISRLSRASISHISELYHRSASPPQAGMSVTRTESTNIRRPLRMQSSMSRLRQRVGLDRELYPSAPIPIPKATTPEPERAPLPLPKDDPPLRAQKSLPRMNSTTSRSIKEPRLPLPPKDPEQQKPLPMRKPSTVVHQPSPPHKRPASIERKPSPPLAQLPKPSSQKLVVRPRRADSGTAVDFKPVHIQERPLGFKEILAVPNHSERMRLYEKAREYWAHADHGLLDWKAGAGGSRMIVVRA